MNIIANYINAFRHNFKQIPQIVCQDGFTISVQASECHYTSPRRNFKDAIMYDKMELGFPNKEESLILEYAENPEKPTETVYGYVPVEIINEVILKHGGLKRPF